MKLRTILMSAVVAMTLAACASKTAQTTTCACGKDKTACADTKECPMHKDAGCAHCKETESASSK